MARRHRYARVGAGTIIILVLVASITAVAGALMCLIGGGLGVGIAVMVSAGVEGFQGWRRKRAGRLAVNTDRREEGPLADKARLFAERLHVPLGQVYRGAMPKGACAYVSGRDVVLSCELEREPALFQDVVLAHELGHIAYRDTLVKSILRGLLNLTLTFLAVAAGYGIYHSTTSRLIWVMSMAVLACAGFLVCWLYDRYTELRAELFAVGAVPGALLVDACETLGGVAAKRRLGITVIAALCGRSPQARRLRKVLTVDGATAMVDGALDDPTEAVSNIAMIERTLPGYTR